MIKCGVEAVTSLKFKCDRFTERIFFVRLNNPSASLLHHCQEVVRGDALLMGEGDPERYLVICLMELIEEHAWEASTAASTCRHLLA